MNMDRQKTRSVYALTIGYAILSHLSPSAAAQGLEEVIVTAQKREQSLQDTPIAVTAFSQSDLYNKNVTDISQIADFTPNLIFDATAPLSGASSAAVLFIRGVGQSSYQVTDDPGVGTYVDGVYVGSSVGGVLDIIDVERIEVLRGPQGTLFGRNTIGGAISITSARPSADDGGSLEITLGNYDRINLRGSTNLVLTDNLVAKVSAGYKRADGWVKLLAESDAPGTENNRNQDTPGNDNEGSARLAFLYTPTDDLDVYFTADKSVVREASAASTLLGVSKMGEPIPGDDSVDVNYGNLSGLYNDLTAPNIDVPGYGTNVLYDDRWVPDNPARESYRNGVNGTDIDTLGAALTLDWNINEYVTLKSISSFRDVEAALNRDADGSPLTITHCFNNFDHEQFSQEFQFTGDAFDSKLTWLAGVYYFEEEAEDDFKCELGGIDEVNGGRSSLLLRASVENDSSAAFAQGTYSFTDSLSLTFGARYTEDTKTLDPLFGFVESFDNIDTIENTIPPEKVSQDFDDSSFRLSVDYRVSGNLVEDLMLYSSYSEGFKSGGFSSRTLVARPEPLPFDPEELATFEVGAKYQGFDSRLRANLAIFSSEYENIQGTVIEGIAPGTQNTGDSDIKGFELELTGLATDNFKIDASVAYTDNEYTRLAPLSEGVAPNGKILMTDKLPNTPEWSYTMNLDYSIPLSSGIVSLRGDYVYYSEIYNDDLNSEILKQPSYNLIGAQIAYESYEGNWDVSIWGRNLGDEEYIISGDDNVFLGFREANFGTPRTYGVTLRKNFQ
ncbi:TonB-dependent receptor [Halieaceae bacterium IMCC8485]|uniref:TonB-dependent receptor n=1 Tax=Candidatus Seongchinamella marina TaxID=2518990 RepID=A0ABT3SZK3_9GAMM|nr:TonB-dependent receptor [Candidatus Seongchinamella marina]MCX2975433.1 TonB-dependent receptor [Candidatus Seongchinamella marina]